MVSVSWELLVSLRRSSFFDFLILFDPTNNKKQTKIAIKRDWEDIWMGLEEIRWRKECGMGERQTKHTTTENIKNNTDFGTHEPVNLV